MLGKHKQDIILIGGGGHCKSVIDVIESNQEFRIAGIIDVKDKQGSNLLGFPFIGIDEDIPALVEKYKYFHISVGHILSNANRVRIFQLVSKLGGEFPTLKANDAYVSTFASISSGTFIGHKAVINAGAKIGVNNIINTGAIIDHDSIIGDHCHLSTGSIINGDVIIGNGVFVGSGAVLKNEISIGDNCLIGMGSVVSKSIGEGSKVYGNPAK